jgi:N12 class adenine-specific DNA methylase
LFDEVGDIPTAPERIDPGGTPLPPALPVPVLGSPPEEGRDDHGTAHDFVPGLEVRAPSGAMNRALANLDALTVLNDVSTQGRPATDAEQDTLARWSGWGAVPQMFEPHRHQWAGAQQSLREVLTEAQYREAAATTLNAHYTDPAVARDVWSFLHAAGFTGGRVLEPGSGAGTFIGQAPESASMVGVELDSATARISALLYPSAQVRNEGFELTRVPENSFVATVGNVPFGKYALHDPAHNPHSHSIHNHFILKSLALTAPGGYVAVLSSRYTLDAANPRARQEMAEAADLVGAVRLPTGAFSRVAGTEVVTDLIVLRKRGQDEAAQADQGWVHVAPVEVAGPDGENTTIEINAYFAEHPDRVLGQLRTGHGQFGSDDLIVRGPVGAEMGGNLRGALAAINREAQAHRLSLDAFPDNTMAANDRLFDRGMVTAATAERPPVLDTLRYDDRAQSLRRWDGEGWVAHPAGQKKLGEFRELLALRDTTQALIDAHNPDTPADQRDGLRGELNRLYDDYVRAHGPINRFVWTQPKDITGDKHDTRMAGFERTWRAKEGVDGVPYDGPVPEELWQDWDERAWTPSTRSKRFAHLDGGIRDDPGFATVAMLEVYDEETQTARKAPIFSTDVLTPPTPRVAVDSVGDAVAISMDESGAVDVSRVAALLGGSEQDARAAMVGVVFHDTTDPTQLIPAARYLSGNVRTKLAEAEAAQHRDGGYAENVEALREVIPRTIEAAEIAVRPGVPWIPTQDYEAFVREVLGADRVSVDYTLGAWKVDVPGWQRTSPLMTDVYGTGDYDAAKLLEAVCNSRPIQVTRPPADVEERGGDPVDLPKTFAAQAQARKLTEKFKEWVFTDDARRDRLVDEYNTRFNSLRPARYDGSNLALPGLGGMVPHPHQRDAVARIVGEPTVLLDHVVGAGKTGVMFMGAMELKRLGMARQPWIVVPNHILEQVGREAMQWYPGANVLVGTNTDNAEKRRRFAAQTATADWDMVIVPKSVFTAIGVSPERRIAHLEKEGDALREAHENATNPIGQKKIQVALMRQEKRLKDLIDHPKDSGLSFEQTGCDYLFVDEAHMYKNRGRVSGVAELACTPGAQQAEDLALKLEALRERRRDAHRAAGGTPDASVERVATFATGTPVANSLGEMWVMQSYLRPDLLEAAGVGGIDAWGTTFTGTVSTIEMNASGSKLKPVTRIGRFVNVPELVTMSSVYTDVVTRDDVPAALPTLVGGQRQVLSMPADQEVRDFIVDLAWRAEHFDPKRPDMDNILKVTSDGRNVSLDPRLGNLAAPLNGGRAGVVAEQIMRIHHDNEDTVYRDDAGAEAPIPGALQIVFCDRATPNKNGRWSIYDGVRDELVARGMDPAAVRFVHDYPKAGEKAQLFADCRNGRVSVLLGSTEKMGTGTNIQDRAIALHHLDVPWRPADLEQREGRLTARETRTPRWKSATTSPRPPLTR